MQPQMNAKKRECPVFLNDSCSFAYIRGSVYVEELG